ncbi:CoA transferase subunit A [Ottowia thiooxydans]|uniref:Glutaconate CoA-transferase subunit A n=1 Tax=Ottowia thiooxydans TaxID=219182 RepID=A0ABV2Q8Y1_9BURK
MTQRTSIQASAADALAWLKDGATLAIGGSLFHNKPMRLIREIARRRTRGLTVVAITQASIDVDLLIAAGCVAEVRVPYLGFEYLGLASNFRRHAADGRLRVWDCDETQVIAGIEATAKNLPSGITKTGVGTDLLRTNPDLRAIDDPITGEPMVAVPAIRPDVSIIHASRGDRWGNLTYAGYPFSDVLIAEATRRCGGKVIASVDELVPPSLISADPFRTTIAHILVDAVVEAPWGAHPCSSHGSYQYDEAYIENYQVQARKGELEMDSWLNEHVRTQETHEAYLDRSITPSRLAALRKDIYAGS